MRHLLTFFAMAAVAMVFAQVPIDQLKAEGKVGRNSSIRSARWKTAIPKLNDLSSAKAISKVRDSFKTCKSKDEAFRTAAKWVKLKHYSAVDTCASIEVLYHLQLWVKPDAVYHATVKAVWDDHSRLANPKVMEHARQAVLLTSSWDGISVPYPVHKVVFDTYDDDPAMAALSRGLYGFLDGSDGKEIMRIAKVFEFRSRHLNGLVLDEMKDARSSPGHLLIAAAAGWLNLIEKPSYPTAKKECLRLFREAAAIKGKSKQLEERIKKFEATLKRYGVT
jgi:hypothetical protein